MDKDTRILRAKLILEEAFETVYALGVSVGYPSSSLAKNEETGDMPLYLDALVYRADLEYNPVEVIDGCCDIKVVTTGTLVAMGVPDEPFQHAVDANNLAKFGPGGYRREDGKWVKPPGHKPPDIEGILQELQIERERHERPSSNQPIRLSYCPEATHFYHTVQEREMALVTDSDHGYHDYILAKYMPKGMEQWQVIRKATLADKETISQAINQHRIEAELGDPMQSMSELPRVAL